MFLPFSLPSLIVVFGICKFSLLHNSNSKVLGQRSLLPFFFFFFELLVVPKNNLRKLTWPVGGTPGIILRKPHLISHLRRGLCVHLVSWSFWQLGEMCVTWTPIPKGKEVEICSRKKASLEGSLRGHIFKSLRHPWIWSVSSGHCGSQMRSLPKSVVLTSWRLCSRSHSPRARAFFYKDTTISNSLRRKRKEPYLDLSQESPCWPQSEPVPCLHFDSTV